ncbi:MAG TPA: N-formylglutamate amidohydrolase [Pseudonocardia sp.]
MVIPGDRGSCVLLHVPHAGTQVPDWTRPHLLLDDAALAAEIAALTDHRTDELARAAADLAAVRPAVLVNPVSRFVVDVERFPDEREEMAAVGMGAVYTHGTRGQPIRAAGGAHAEALLAAYFRPWGETVARLVDEGVAALLDVHSYPARPLPYERHADGPRPEVCLGTDPTHTPSWLVEAARTAFAGFEVGLDSPFSGAYVPHGRTPAALMLEIRRDVHAARAAALATALADLVDAAQRGT